MPASDLIVKPDVGDRALSRDAGFWIICSLYVDYMSIMLYNMTG